MSIEDLPYQGESPYDQLAYERYKAEIVRGKSLIQLMAVRNQMTALIRQSWSARSFTPIITSEGEFDAIVCNIAYHFTKHGAKYGNILFMTLAAKKYFEEHRQEAVVEVDLYRMPNRSLFELDGRIVTFFE